MRQQFAGRFIRRVDSFDVIIILRTSRSSSTNELPTPSLVRWIENSRNVLMAIVIIIKRDFIASTWGFDFISSPRLEDLWPVTSNRMAKKRKSNSIPFDANIRKFRNEAEAPRERGTSTKGPQYLGSLPRSRRGWAEGEEIMLHSKLSLSLHQKHSSQQRAVSCSPTLLSAPRCRVMSFRSRFMLCNVWWSVQLFRLP